MSTEAGRRPRAGNETDRQPRPGTEDDRQPRPLLPALAGMRFLAAATVFTAHASLQVPFSNVVVGGLLLFGVTPIGFSAVSYFFMLSGFVLTWTRRSDDTAGAFFRRRFSRLIPSHLIVLTVAVTLAVLTDAAVGLPQVLTQGFLLQAWIPRLGYIDVLNSATWSISAEVFFYLLFPLLVPLLWRIRPARLWAWVGGVFALIIALPFADSTLVPYSDPEHPLAGMSLVPFLRALSNPDQVLNSAGAASYTQVWFVYHFPLARLLDFVVGVLLARIVMSRRWIGIRPRTALLLLVPTWVAGMFVPFLFRTDCLYIIPGALFLGALAARNVDGHPTRIGTRRMVQLGNLTYGFYLVHGLVLIYGHQALGTVETEDGPELRSFSVPVALGLLVLGFALSLFLAWVLYRFVETPSTRRFGASRATRAAAADDGRSEPDGTPGPGDALAGGPSVAAGDQR